MKEKKRETRTFFGTQLYLNSKKPVRYEEETGETDGADEETESQGCTSLE